MVSERIKTKHGARLRLDHGEDCEGCQDIGLQMALHIVALTGWRIVRTEPTGEPGRTAVYVIDEWTPASGVAAPEGDDRG